MADFILRFLIVNCEIGRLRLHLVEPSGKINENSDGLIRSCDGREVYRFIVRPATNETSEIDKSLVRDKKRKMREGYRLHQIAAHRRVSFRQRLNPTARSHTSQSLTGRRALSLRDITNSFAAISRTITSTRRRYVFRGTDDPGFLGSRP